VKKRDDDVYREKKSSNVVSVAVYARIYYYNYVIKLPGLKESGIRVESGEEKTRVVRACVRLVVGHDKGRETGQSGGNGKRTCSIIYMYIYIYTETRQQF